ncbi:hypothetical protein LXL04_039551 [Taraxacum kok-saghyz]
MLIRDLVDLSKVIKRSTRWLLLGVSKNRTGNRNRTNNRKNRNRKNRNRDNNRKNRTETVTITAKTATAKTEPQPKPQPHRKTETAPQNLGKNLKKSKLFISGLSSNLILLIAKSNPASAPPALLRSSRIQSAVSTSSPARRCSGSSLLRARSFQFELLHFKIPTITPESLSPSKDTH